MTRSGPGEVHAVFALAGACAVSWGSRVPDIRDRLDLTPGGVGWVLLSVALGSVVGLPVSGALCGRWGSRTVVRVGVLLVLVAELAAALAIEVAASAVLLGCSWVVMGLGIGLWDVAMNLEGAEVERRLGRSIMPRFHASYSLGTVGGALLGALLSWARVPVGVHLAVATSVFAALAWFVVRRFGVAPADDLERPAVGHAWHEPRVLLLGLMVLAAAFTEGTANDWLSVAFVDGHHLPPWAGVLALATFLTFMTGGRVLGTHLLDRHGRVAVLRTLFVVASIGSLMVVWGDRPVAFVGAALWGLGRPWGSRSA